MKGSVCLVLKDALPFLPLSPMEWKFQNKTSTEPFIPDYFLLVYEYCKKPEVSFSNVSILQSKATAYLAATTLLHPLKCKVPGLSSFLVWLDYLWQIMNLVYRVV